MVARDRVVGAIRRVAAPGEWRTNVALGGRREPLVPPREARELALAAATAVGGALVGIDLLPAEDGFVVLEVNGAVEFTQAYSLGGESEINTNQAESFFSRMRRAEIGHHHHLAGPYLIRFAQEAAWREDHRRDRNGDQVDRIVALSMAHKPSIDFAGYWQRHVRA